LEHDCGCTSQSAFLEPMNSPCWSHLLASHIIRCHTLWFFPVGILKETACTNSRGPHQWFQEQN
jgi:hypothetical protein